MFQINDKVVCVDDSINPAWTHIPPLVKGVIYCVGGMDVHPYYKNLLVLIVGQPCILPSEQMFAGTDVGWRPERFRKVGCKTEDVADESAITERVG